MGFKTIQCRDCGSDAQVEWHEQDPELTDEQKARWERISNSYARLLRCDSCEQAWLSGRRTAKEYARGKSVTDNCYERGLVPQSARSATFKSSNAQHECRNEAIRLAFAWGRDWNPKESSRWVYIEGPAGTGKTYFAECLLNRAMSLGVSAAEVQAEQLQKWGQGWVEGDKHVANLMNCGVVLIEEVGQCDWNETGIRTLRKVVDNAYRGNKVLIFTANLRLDELGWKFNAASKADMSISASLRDRMRYKLDTHEFIGDSLRKLETVA